MRSSPQGLESNFSSDWQPGVAAGLVMAFLCAWHHASVGLGFWTPLKTTAAAVLGVSALVGGASSVMLGATIHLVVSAFWGIVFKRLIQRYLPADRILWAGLIFGVAVWAIMTFGILPKVNRTMLERIRWTPSSWFIAHLVYGFFVGTILLHRRHLAAPPSPALAGEGWGEGLHRRQRPLTLPSRASGRGGL